MQTTLIKMNPYLAKTKEASKETLEVRTNFFYENIIFLLNLLFLHTRKYPPQGNFQGMLVHTTYSGLNLRMNKAPSCSKLALFKTFWQMIRVLPWLSSLYSYVPQLRAFQWGTLWLCTSRVIKNKTTQNWKINFY